MGLNELKELNNETFVLKTALLVYKNKRPNYNSYPYYEHFMTEHSIVNGKIAEGKPLTKQSLLGLASMVMPRLKDEVHFLPSNVLYYSPLNGILVWWRKASTEHLLFDRSMKIRSGKAPVPALLLAVIHSKLYVWALKGGKRPNTNTILFNSPFFNVDNSGTCMGNVSIPEKIGIEMIPEWEKIFFGSFFTNHHFPQLNGISGQRLWKSLVGSGKKLFPHKHLIKYDSLDAFISRLKKMT